MHAAFLTWIPAVRSVRHVCGDNAPPAAAAASCLYRAFKRIHDGHCWLLFLGRAGTKAARFPQHTPSASLGIFLLELRMRIWPPIHPGKASPPFPETEKTPQEVAAFGLALIGLPRTLRTSAPYMRPFVSRFYSTRRKRLSPLRHGELRTGRCPTKTSSLGEK